MASTRGKSLSRPSFFEGIRDTQESHITQYSTESFIYLLLYNASVCIIVSQSHVYIQGMFCLHLWLYPVYVIFS